jgi:phage shock protein PspC (stress-responsive transcriptional regulator)
MNRTITSNIAGTVFHIDEDAFRKLEQYLSDIRSFYAGQEGEDDIVSGIEERIGEIFQGKVKGGQTIITMNDVDAVISVMGRPEAFEGEDDAEPVNRTSSKKGSGSAKRLFRDPDSRVLGGVCSGVSHYLGIHDPVWFRLAFLLTFIFAGTGLLLYIILWIVIPNAKTPSEKLEMKGENVTVDNISRTVNEELEGLRQKWDNTSVGKSGIARQFSDLVVKVISFIAQVLIAFARFLAKFIGLLLLLVGAITFIVLAGTALGLPMVIHLGSEGVVTADTMQGLLANIAGGTWNAAFASIAFILLIGVPFLALAFIGARLLFNIKRGNRAVAITLAALWTMGWILGPIMAAVIAKDFSSLGERTEQVDMEFTSGTDERPIVLALNHELGEDEPTEEGEVLGMGLLFVNGKTSIYGKPQLDIVQAKDDKVQLVMVRSARGESQRVAAERANAIDYGFVSNDTALLFNGYFAIPDADRWRNQDVQLQLHLPVGKTVLLTEEMERIIYDIKNTTDTYDGDMVGRRWRMTEKGLTCVDCEGLETPPQGEKGQSDRGDRGRNGFVERGTEPRT